MVRLRHLVPLTDDDLADLCGLLHLAGSHSLLEKLTIMPLVNENGSLSERGQSAAIRIVREMAISSEHQGAEELREAIKEGVLADAYLEISLYEGEPGKERSRIVDRHIAAQARLRDVAVAYLEARLEKD